MNLENKLYIFCILGKVSQLTGSGLLILLLNAPKFNSISSAVWKYKVKSQSVLLLPFVSSVFIYFAFEHDRLGEIWTTIIKCTPILFLMLYILAKGFRLSKEYKSSQRILLGLIFSSVGDALLNFDLFPHGMGAFAITQICYISAIKWSPLKWQIGLAMFLPGAGLVALVIKNLDNVLIVGLPIYATLLLTMSWRAVSRGADKKDIFSVCCGVGSILFVISDGLICIDMFYIAIPYARIWIMMTYYIAQFAIALSTAKESKYVQASKKTPKPASSFRESSKES